MKWSKGFTIVTVMVFLLILGIVLSLVVKAVIDQRCEDDPGAKICASRTAS